MEKNTTIKQSWYEFYKCKCNNEYYNYICKKYKPFIDEIKKEIKKDFLIEEMGCGIGNITKQLTKHFSNNRYIISDICYSVVALSKQHCYKEGLDISFQWMDITLPYYRHCNLIHSHGVLEHFEDWEIKHILTSQLNRCPLLIHYVPSDKYDYKSFGDERLLPKEHWKEKFDPTEIIEFNDGYDLILKWRKQ